jgi:ABC-type uncharacterized transport system fused permease/ATPase subunit
VPIGTLRDLVIYPLSANQLSSYSKNDDDVRKCLK